MKRTIVGLSVLLSGCTLNPLAMTQMQLHDAPQYALALQTPVSERIEGTVRLVESYNDNNVAFTRVWVVGENSAYVLQCPEYHAVRNLNSPGVVSLTGKVLGREDGVRIYDGNELCERLE